LLTAIGLASVSRACEGGVRAYSRPVAVESAMDAEPLIMGDLTSMEPPLILSARCECVGDATSRATPPPSISVSDMSRYWRGI
jgi:hypothetical protein